MAVLFVLTYIHFNMYKEIPSETSVLPSMFSQHTADGVQSRLGVDESKPATYNGARIEDMRGNPIYARVDQIDRKGMVQKALEKHVKEYAKSDFRRSFYEKLQRSRKPSLN